MKIYFEDGELRTPFQLAFSNYYIVDASRGYSENRKRLDSISQERPNATVYTNSIIAFSNEYAWNDELEVPEIYIRAGEYMTFTRIDELTTRELRVGHNLMKMYMAEEFDQIKGE